MENQILYYIINTAGKGFVIVSSDDRTIPVLGYSGESVWTIFTDTVYACNVRGWMESYEKQVLEAGMTNSLPAVFSLAGKPAGVYYIRVETSRGVMTGKVVKI